MRWLGLAFLILSKTATASRLPVFLADNHAETFGWIARTYDLNDPLTLVLVDAHADASAAADSDEVREQLRRVPDTAERNRRIEAWRSGGRIQAFNWIEPLMPMPVGHVLWMGRVHQDQAGLKEAARDAVDYLDGRLEIEPRVSGSFANRFETRDFTGLKSWRPEKRKILLAVDLDFFTGMEDAEMRFEELWETAVRWPGLAGVAFSISRPWLEDDAEADRLVAMVVNIVRRTRGADLECDLAIDDRPDNSLKHVESARTGKPTPRWDVTKAPTGLRTLLGNAPKSWRMADRNRAFSTLGLDGAKAGTIHVDAGLLCCDGATRTGRNGGVLRVEPGAGVEATGRVRWFVRQSALKAYDLVPGHGPGGLFSKNPGRWIYEKRLPLAETTDGALDDKVWRKHLEGPAGCGRVMVEADYETHDGWLPVEEVDLRVPAEADGFRGALGECFGMPYAYGVALESDAGGWSVDSGWGSDCSNFLAYAWRQRGVASPWGNPAQLRIGMITLAEHAGTNRNVPIRPDQVALGLMVDFGTHVAAVWEDRAPLGVLDGSDLLAHHLGGRPEISTLSALAETRPKFAVRMWPESQKLQLAIAGDVVLAGEPAGVEEFVRAMAGADLALANLEGVCSGQPASANQTDDFRFPRERLEILKRAGVTAVGMANNHAFDAGRDGLLEGKALVENAGITVIGAGANLAEALKPWRTAIRGTQTAVFAVCAVDAPAAGENKPGVLRLPEHAEHLDRALSKCAMAGETTVVLIHWGDAFAPSPNENQRHWARWLTERGVKLVVGSGPHVIQPGEWHAGGRILHSLGNAVYPKNLSGPGNGKVEKVVITPVARFQ